MKIKVKEGCIKVNSINTKIIANGITFINITDITRQGLKETYLVATDGLHPSEKAYSLFVDRIAPKASVIVQK